MVLVSCGRDEKGEQRKGKEGRRKGAAKERKGVGGRGVRRGRGSGCQIRGLSVRFECQINNRYF